MRADDEKLEAGLKIALEKAANFKELMVETIKGHLFIEQAMDAFLQASVAAPRHLPKRIGFADKVRFCRAMSFDQSEDQFWTVIGSINGLRNAIAHGKPEDKVAEAFGTVKAEWLACFTGARREEQTGLRDHELVQGACTTCAGFVWASIDQAKQHQ